MKKIYSIMAASLMFLAIGCNKEDNFPKTFTAGIEQSASNSKMYLDGQYLKWDGSEQVKVFSNAGGNVIYNVTPQTDPTWATLTSVSGLMSSGTYTAIYPASTATSSTIVTLPTTQQSPDGSLCVMPMIAESSTTTFQFHNLCGVMKVHLQQSGVLVKSIKVTASSPIAGEFTIGGTMSVPTLTSASGNTNTSTTLLMTNNQSIADGNDFYIYLPAGTYSTMSLEITNSNDGTCTKNANNITICRSQIHPINVSNMDFVASDLLSGEFSVSATQSVRFSKGNLQFQSSTYTWRFAANQYDICGSNNNNITTSNTYSGWIDLFGWSTASTYYGVSTSTNSSDYSGDFVDWGTVFGVNSPWRTLSKAEWDYIINDRSNASSLYGIAQIEMSTGSYVHGVVFLPDNWSSSNGCSFTAGVSSHFGYWNLNSYTITQWETLQSYGAIFLPIAGDRWGTYYNNFNSSGDYWTSTRDNNEYSMSLRMYQGIDVWTANLYTKVGTPVRLVQDVE